MGKYTKISKKKYDGGGPIIPTMNAGQLPAVNVEAEKPTWVTFKEESEKTYPKSKFIREYFPIHEVKSRLATSDPLPSIAQREYDKRINDLVAEKILKDRPVGNDWDASTYMKMYTPTERDIIFNSKHNSGLIGKQREANIDDSIAAQDDYIIGNPNWKNALAKQTQATGDKLRFSNQPNFFDDNLNPAAWIGNMASNLGQSPLKAQEQNSYLPYVKAIGEPLAVGLGEGIINPAVDRMIGQPIAEHLVNPFLNPTKEVLKTAFPASIKTIPQAKNLREAIGTFAGIPTERSLPRLSAQDLKAYRAIQELGRLRDLKKPIADQYEYALLNLPEEHIKRIYGKSKDELTSLLKATKESADNFDWNAVNSQRNGRGGIDITQGSIDLRRPVTNEIRRWYNIPPIPPVSNLTNNPDYGLLIDDLMPHLVDNARNNNSIPSFNSIYRNVAQTKNSATTVINNAINNQATKLRQGVGNYISEYPVYRGDVKQNVPVLFLRGTTKKGVQQNVADMATHGVESGDVFAGSLNTSHSSYLPQLKRTFDYKGGTQQFLNYRPMNSSGYLSQAGYTPDEIARYLNTEIDTYISRGKLPSNIQRPFLDEGNIYLPHYGVKQHQYGGYINNDMNRKKYNVGGRMNQAQQLNQAKMRIGSDAPDGSVWKDIGAGAFGVLEGTLDTVTMGATDKLTDAAYKGLQKIGGSDASQVRQQDMIHGFGNIGGAAIGAAVNPASGMTAISQGVKGLGQGIGNINENTQGIGNAISGLSSLTGLIPSGGGNIGSTGQQEMEQMGAAMKMAQGGLMHINEGGTHEQNALGGVPIGPNALVEQGETINNDFVFSDRLKPKGSKKTYAQLSKSVDTKYRLRPDDKLSKEAKQMDLDRLAAQQEAQKDEMSTKYMQKAMACGGKIMASGGNLGNSFMGPISQSMPVTNGQNTLLANGGMISNFMEPTPQYYNPADLDNQYAHGGSIHIKPENRGKFTASANRAGMGVQEFAGHVLANKEDYSSTQVKRANFARNASKWKHAMGGNMYAWGGNPSNGTSYFQYDEMGNPDFGAQQMYNPNNESYSTAPVQGPNMENGQFATGYPKLQGVQVDGYLPKVNAFNYPDPKAVTAYPYDKYAGANQNPYPEVGNTGYLTNLAGNLVKAGMVATSKPPIYNPSVKFGRMNANPAERLAMQEGRREIQGTKDIIRNNATSSGQYLTNASLMGANAANKLAGTIGGIRQSYDQQNVGIGNQEAQLNQQITAANNLAKETFRDNRLNQYNKILDSVIGANQQRFATDEHANNFQNQAISMLKTKDFHVGRKDKNGMFEVLDINGNIVGTLDNYGVAKDLLGNPIK